MKCKLYINKIVGKTFNKKASYIRNNINIQFQKDLAKSYGLVMEEKLLEEGRNLSFSYMCSQVIDPIKDLVEDIDLLVIAHCTPNIDPAVSTVNNLIEKYSLKAKGFAISDIGIIAPFIAIKSINDSFISGKSKKALLLIVDQSTLPYKVSELKQIVDSSIACILESDSKPGSLGLKSWSNGDLSQEANELIKHSEKQSLILRSSIKPNHFRLSNENWDSIASSSSGYLCTELFFELSKYIEKNRVPSEIILIDGEEKDNLYKMSFKQVGE